MSDPYIPSRLDVLFGTIAGACLLFIIAVMIGAGLAWLRDWLRDYARRSSNRKKRLINR